MGAWARSLLVGLVFAFGLLQGSRAALGDIALGGEPKPESDVEAVTGHVEPDALRGYFFRPHGSTAVRPPLRLRVSRWSPDEPRLALSCPTGC